MKGKKAFSKSDTNEIRTLINELNLLKQNTKSSDPEQKRIREKLRKLGFFISDFKSGKEVFTLEDFENLINGQQTKIITNQKSFEDVDNRLIMTGIFYPFKDLNQDISNSNGFYCIKLRPNSKLPDRYQVKLDERKHTFMYIGIAKGQTLRKRVQQEFGKGSPGAFFRNIGCTLGYLAVKGCLKNKSASTSFVFSPNDKKEIKQWLFENTEVSIIESGSFKIGDLSIEDELIKKYHPLLNRKGNDMKLQELEDDMKKCNQIAKE